MQSKAPRNRTRRSSRECLDSLLFRRCLVVAADIGGCCRNVVGNVGCNMVPTLCSILETMAEAMLIPFITHNNKTIFILVIDIFNYPKSASKCRQIEAYEIPPQEFVDSLSE